MMQKSFESADQSAGTILTSILGPRSFTKGHPAPIGVITFGLFMDHSDRCGVAQTNNGLGDAMEKQAATAT